MDAHAPPGERAEATSALARAYLYSDLSPDDLAAAEGAMIMLLDDPSPLVRRALAEVFAVERRRRRRRWCTRSPPISRRSPRRCWSARRCCSTPIWSISVATGAAGSAGRDRQRAPCCRARSPRPSPRSAAPRPAWRCWKIADAEIAPFSLDRIVERFGHLAAIRENLLARDDLPMATRQALVAKLSRDARRLRHRAPMARPRTRRNASRARPARRRPSRSPPTRRTSEVGR